MQGTSKDSKTNQTKYFTQCLYQSWAKKNNKKKEEREKKNITSLSFSITVHVNTLYYCQLSCWRKDERENERERKTLLFHQKELGSAIIMTAMYSDDLFNKR